MDPKNQIGEQLPQAIGRYQIQGLIGFGAMGAVYKAFDPLIKRTLAIKTIRLDIPRQSPQYKSFIERFYHEARISGTLSHPNIVTLFDIGEEGGVPYLAMEYVEGETLASMIEKGVRYDPERVIGLVSQVASAVDYAHSRGVIHRDIKPSNLILFDAERIKVTDFGIAKLADAEMTQSGTLLGTPSYMSPEQAMGEKIDGRSDIFSLGVCAFEMLSGEQPFPGANVTSILYKLVHVDPIEPASLEMHGLVPQKWHEVFGKVLAKKPDERYQTASEFVQDLEYCLGSWFGSAMVEETISEANTLRVPVPPSAVKGGASQEETTALPAVTAGTKPATPSTAAPAKRPTKAAASAAPPLGTTPTTLLPAVRSSSPSIAAPAPPVAAVPTATPPPSAKSQATVQKPAPAMPAPVAVAPTQPLPAVRPSATPASPPAPSAPAPTTVQPAAAPPPSIPARTVPAAPSPKPSASMPVAGPAVPPTPPVPTAVGPTTHAAPADELPATVLMKAPSPPTPATTRKPTETPKPPGAESETPATVVMTSTQPIAIPKGAGAPSPLTITGGVPQETMRGATPAPAAPPRPTRSTPSPPPMDAVPAPPPTVMAPAPTEEVRRPGLSPAVVLGGAAAVFVVAVAIVGYVLSQKFGMFRREAATPTPVAGQTEASAAPAPTPSIRETLGVLHVESQPPGGDVTVNGESKGAAPIDLADLPFGDYEVRVELKGYQTFNQRLSLSNETPRGEITAALKPAGPAMGVVDVLSTPFGAVVTLDGANVGRTPLAEYRLKLGVHQITLNKEGYRPRSTSFKVEAGKRARVDIQLDTIPTATPVPTPVDAVDTSRVYNNVPSEVDTMAKKISGAGVSYPSNAPRLRSGESVSSSVSFVVSPDGETEEIKVVESGGTAIDEAVMAAVRNWRYSPAVKKGVKVKVRLVIKQTFRAG